MISSAPKVRSASSIAWSGSPSPTSPRASIPASRSRARLASSRCCACSRALSTSEVNVLTGEFSAGVTTSTSVRLPEVCASIRSRSASPPTVSLAITRMRRSSAAPRRTGAACRGASIRRARIHQSTTPTERTMKTTRPAQRLITPAIAISPKYTAAPSRNRNASASLLSGFFMRSEDVDRRVDDDPHHVDEVPVDPGDLDAEVRLRRVVAAIGPDGRRQEQRQADEDVRSVQSGQAVEDRPERVRVKREAEARVLADLRQQERQPEQEGERQAGLQAGAVAALDRLQRPVHREARADEDDRVDPRHEDGKLVPRGRPRLAVRHTDEEVGREERAEEHHLGGDEE